MEVINFYVLATNVIQNSPNPFFFGITAIYKGIYLFTIKEQGICQYLGKDGHKSHEMLQILMNYNSSEYSPDSIR